jgi:hypothetical protein
MRLNNKTLILIAGAVLFIFHIFISRGLNFFKDFNVKEFLETVLLVVNIKGILWASQKNRKRKNLSRPVIQTNYNLNISLESSLYGGLTGGILCGMIVAILFYYKGSLFVVPSFFESIAIVPCCALIGCLFGSLIYLGRRLFSHINILNHYGADFLGCLSACIIAGGLSGMLGMFLFGDKNFPFIGYDRIVIGSIVGALGLIFGTLIYDYDGKLKYVFFSLVIALVLSSFISIFGFLIIQTDFIESLLLRKIYSTDSADLIEGGLLIGVINGVVFGLVIGFTVIFYKYWRFAEKQERAHRALTVAH